MKVNICGCPALWMCRGFGTCLCRTLCRTEQIRMKYWVHLWISGAERPLVGASACIFSWWKPLDGSFLLAASLKSESQKCNASWRQKKRPRYIEVERWWGFSLLQLKSRLWRSTLAPKIVSQKKKKRVGILNYAKTHIVLLTEWFQHIKMKRADIQLNTFVLRHFCRL